jgi:hypothetical protein
VKIDTFFAELKRRNVYKVAIAYIVGGWALSQGVAQVFPVFGVPNWVIRATRGRTAEVKWYRATSFPSSSGAMFTRSPLRTR